MPTRRPGRAILSEEVEPDRPGWRRIDMLERRTVVILLLMMVVTFSAFGVAEGLEQAEQGPAPAGVLAE